MKEYYFNPEVKLLLIQQSDEKVKVVYDDNESEFLLPFISARPPFYTNPRYVPEFPII
ncbi:hypothetical protein [Lederbergia graminis]|uniref:Uncharacterized protein n=1 Tax=Lederbergia graminis TaxID=735518 RepID=A0ABW0LHV7_9BACI|nr:hypothetical protein [Paenibacillus bovis]HLU23088.1 hypothetical protein [Bacillaceae bacterium]